MDKEKAFPLLTAAQKQISYDNIKTNLKKFYSSYDEDKFSLGQQAKYTIVSAAINNEFGHFNFVGFYTVEARTVKNDATTEKLECCTEESIALKFPRLLFNLFSP